MPKLYLAEDAELAPAAVAATLPELPWERARATRAPSVSRTQQSRSSARRSSAAQFFDTVAKALGDDAKLVALAANYAVSDLAGIYAKKESEGYAALDPESFAALIRLAASGELSSRGAKDTLALLVESGGDPAAIAREHGLIQSNDVNVLGQAVDAALAAEPKAVEEYFRSGKQAALQYLIGKAMKESRGAGNPERLKSIILEKLG